MAKKVTKIEPVRQNVIQTLRPKKRVCAYCRVSTDSTKQHTSYVAQVEYYESYIGKREDWEFVGIFADEAKSGTKVKSRDEFLRMMLLLDDLNAVISCLADAVRTESACSPEPISARQG